VVTNGIAKLASDAATRLDATERQHFATSLPRILKGARSSDTRVIVSAYYAKKSAVITRVSIVIWPRKTR
jgi:hypothetical protein